jgi:hypothetical protein
VAIVGEPSNLQHFALTFGLRYGDEEHPTFAKANPRGWVTVLAPGYEAARALVHERIGNDWAFLYPVADFRATRYPAGEIARWSTTEPETPPLSSGALLDQASADGVHHTTVMRLWCCLHGASHPIPIADVERITYALGFMVPVAYSGLTGPNHPHPDCPLAVLELSHLHDYYLGVVDANVQLRAAQALGVTS